MWWPLYFDFGSADGFPSRPGAFYQQQQLFVSPFHPPKNQDDMTIPHDSVR